MKNYFTKTMATIALAAVLTAAPVSPISTTAEAAYTYDLNIEADYFIQGTAGNTSTFTWTFSGVGISSLAYTASDCTVSWSNAVWAPYPQKCSIDCMVTPDSAEKDAIVTLFLKDEEGGYPYSKSVCVSTTKITGENLFFPDSLASGKGQHLNGCFTSTKSIDAIQASVVDSSGNSVLSGIVYPDSKRYDLYDSALDWKLSFGTLSNGFYSLKFRVWSAMSTEEYSFDFTVGTKLPLLNLENGFAYCDQNWNTRNPEWPNSGSDCSNFAAQFLYYSGLKTDNCFKPGSRTVLGFDNLKDYLYTTYGVNTIMRKSYDCSAVKNGYAQIKSNLSVADIAPGDLVVMAGIDSSGKSIHDGHIMVVYKVDKKRNRVYCYGHSNNRNGKSFYVSGNYLDGVVKTSVLFE